MAQPPQFFSGIFQCHVRCPSFTPSFLPSGVPEYPTAIDAPVFTQHYARLTSAATSFLPQHPAPAAPIPTPGKVRAMPRLASLLLALPFAALAITSTPAQAPQIRLTEPPPPGFHLSTNPAAEARPRPTAIRAHPRPSPLAPGDIARLAPKLGIKPGPIQLYVQTIKYQIESYNQTVGFEVDTPTLTDSILYGATGYVQIDFSVLPGKQFLLDCSLGQDGTYKLATTFLTPNGGSTGWLDGQMSSFNQHLLIPLNTTPANAQGGRVVIDFTEIEFYGCQVDTVSQ